MVRSRYQIIPDDRAPYYMTCTIVNWLPLFGFIPVADILLNSFCFLINEGRIVLHGFVIMENHLHMIASSPNLSKEIGDFKSYTARCIIDYFSMNGFHAILNQLETLKSQHKTKQKYQLWQEGNHPQRITSRTMLNQKLDYIHYNPVRRGYVEEPSHWRYSSYINYQDGEGLLPVQIIGL